MVISGSERTEDLETRYDDSYLSGSPTATVSPNYVIPIKRNPAPKVARPGCKIPMEEQTDKAPIIQLSTRIKWVVFECPNCGVETERRMAV